MDYSDKGIWEREKSICAGCHREITNKAFFAGAHVKGTCQKDKGFTVPKPKWSIPLPHPSKATLNREVTDKEIKSHAHKDWKHCTNGDHRYPRFPETFSELCQWWHLKPINGSQGKWT